MSISYALACDDCRAYIHAGQRSVTYRFTAGFGANDEPGQMEVGQFIARHQHPESPTYLKLMYTEGVPDGYKDEGSP